MVMLDEWRQRAPALQRPLPKLMAPPARRAGPREQLVILSRRHAKLIAREPVVYLARATLMFFTNTFIALVYFNTRELVQEQVRPPRYLAPKSARISDSSANRRQHGLLHDSSRYQHCLPPSVVMLESLGLYPLI